MECFIILILFAAVLILAVKSYLLKKQLKSIFHQLREEQTRLVTVELVDRDIERVVQEINTLLERLTPHFEHSDQAVFVSADPNMLDRVIQNLISNGVKYARGDIFFHVCQDNDWVIVNVSNHVDTDVDIAHIFDRFYTQDKSRSKGSGIGLYICRQLVEAMGGSISAEMEQNRLSIKVMLELPASKIG